MSFVCLLWVNSKRVLVEPAGLHECTLELTGSAIQAGSLLLPTPVYSTDAHGSVPKMANVCFFFFRRKWVGQKPQNSVGVPESKLPSGWAGSEARTEYRANSGRTIRLSRSSFLQVNSRSYLSRLSFSQTRKIAPYFGRKVYFWAPS